MNENLAFDKKQNSIEFEFLQKIKDIPSAEEKIKFLLAEMKTTILKDEKPDFKAFWEIKNICLKLFNEPINPQLRLVFWKEYLLLREEIKSLKKMLNEQSTFEVEQIDLAITSIEEDLEKYDSILNFIKEIEIDNKIKFFFANKESVLTIQKELSFLNGFAAKVNSLRKEVIKTMMKISSKNTFLKRLTLIGDIIFPKRKKFIDEVSKEFINIIETFIKDTFDLHKKPFYILKEQIKSLQNLAKKFTLNTESFTSCRLNLSKCWDKVKVAEKNYKKEKQKSKENIDQVLKKVQNLKSLCEKNPKNKAIEKEEKEIFNLIKSLNLRKEDIKFLKHKIKEAKSFPYQKEKVQKFQNLKKENNQENLRKEQLKKIKQSIKSLIENKALNFDELCQEKKQIEKEIEMIKLIKFEKLILEKSLRELNHLIEDKKEYLETNTSNELKNLLELFESKKKRRISIKSQIDHLNKELSCSGLDFEKAMLYRDLIDSEKQRLIKIDNEIEKLENKIADLESN